MAFCPNCGTKLKEGAKFCPECGKTTGGVPASTGPAKSGQTQQGADEPNKGMAIVAYLLFFIPLLTGDHKKSEFVKYHTNQGTVLFLSSVLYGVAYGIIMAILAAIMLSNFRLIGLFGVITMILGLSWLVVFVFFILGIVHAVKGEMKPLPLIGKITIIK
jgi:uncharacterized membrane protein